uniref:Flotillin n=1 Tax=Anser cygnoides TaxID=8845 RepID=A0A8B9IQW1_ANSCY
MVCPFASLCVDHPFAWSTPLHSSPFARCIPLHNASLCTVRSLHRASFSHRAPCTAQPCTAGCSAEPGQAQAWAAPRANSTPGGVPSPSGSGCDTAPSPRSRLRQHGAVPPPPTLAKATLRALGLALLPRRRRGRRDLAVLRHAGGPRALQRPLLRRLPPAGAVAAGPRRHHGPGAVGGQREAGGAGAVTPSLLSPRVPGGCCGSDVKQYVYGGWAWAWWCITDTQRISLEIMTLQPRCEDVETAEGVALTVTGVAQVKIMTEKELLAVACEQFLGKNVQDVKNVVLQTLEGHLRSILGTLTVEQIYQDRDQFAKLVREVAAPDVGRMGIEILSFTIKDVYDKVDYLSSLGKTQTAAVRRDADIGVAEAERDAGIREAECKKEMLDVKFMADTKIADSRRAFELQKAAFTEEVNIKTAEAQLAYELQSAREQQKIRQEEIEIEVVQRKKQIDVEEKEIIRKEKELIATVKRPAEAEAYRIQQIAEGEKVRQVLMAQAEAEKIRKMGEAEAFVIEAIGMAEAERMKLKAEALQRYGEAAQLALVLDALPEIAAKVAAPLSKVDEIIVLSGESGNVTSEVNRLLAEIPASVRAITGVDLTKIPLIQKATGAQA